jgi:hypothetical protein
MNHDLIQTEFFDPVIPRIVGMGQENGRWWISVDVSGITLEAKTIEKYFIQDHFIQRAELSSEFIFEAFFISDELGSLIFHKYQSSLTFRIIAEDYTRKYEGDGQIKNPDV